MIAAAPAQAGVVELRDDRWMFSASRGERNAITVQAVEGAVRIGDATPPGGCPADGAATVLCAQALPVVVDAGDGDDSIRGDAALEYAYGGSGDDVLEGGKALHGGPGRDRVIGDGGPNELQSDDGGDLLDGRGGDDLVLGNRGADVLRGGPGDDMLSGLDGADRYDAGPGEDTVRLNAAGAVDVRCGAGRDLVHVHNTRGARLHRDCETIDALGVVVRRAGSRLSIRWAPEAPKPRPCRIFVDGKAVRGRTVARPRGLVRVHASRACKGPVGSAYAATAFRLTS